MGWNVDVESDWRVGHDHLREYWSWTGVALYLLLTLDLLTTLYAAALYGPAAESNPFVRAVLTRGVFRLVTLNLAALALSVGLLAAYIRLLRRTRGLEAWFLARGFEAWLGGLIAAGLFVFANNLSVIVLGASLL